MNWLNPIMWYAAFKGYVRAHFWAWNLSSVWTWVSAFGASVAYPEWARELANTWFPLLKEAASALWEWAWSGSLSP